MESPRSTVFTWTVVASCAGGVDDEVDAGVGGHPGGVDAEFQQLVLDEGVPLQRRCATGSG
jgi:hypothetical protein